MPVVVEPDSPTLAALLAAAPAGTQGVDSAERLCARLDQDPHEYVAVLGPHLALEEALRLCEDLRISRPTLSVVLVREELDTPVLARAIKAGARDVVASADTDALAAAVTRAHELHVALRGHTGRRAGRVVTVFSPKGGVGKTTMAVNLALALADGGARRVCLVDLDLAFGDVAITLQLFPKHSIEHAIGSEATLDAEQLEALLTPHRDGLVVLAAPAHPDVRERIPAALVSRVLRTLREEFDHVVVDTSPSFDEPTLTALDETDECVIVATLDVPTLKNVKVALETLDLLDIARDHRHLLLNRADDAVGIDPEKVESILGMGVAAQVSTSIEIAAATNAGTPIVAGLPEHPSSVAVRGLATRLTGEPAGAPGSSAATPATAALAPADAGAPGRPTGRAGRGARRFRIRR